MKKVNIKKPLFILECSFDSEDFHGQYSSDHCTDVIGLMEDLTRHGISFEAYTNCAKETTLMAILPDDLANGIKRLDDQNMFWKEADIMGELYNDYAYFVDEDRNVFSMETEGLEHRALLKLGKLSFTKGKHWAWTDGYYHWEVIA